MKFLQLMKNGAPVLGLLTDRGVVEVSALDPKLPTTMAGLCTGGQALARHIEALAHTAAAPIVEAPVYAPAVTGMEKILCVGLNYRAHALECGLPMPKTPPLFCKFSNALAAHQQTVTLPAGSSQVDYEAELVIVMGEDGDIFGYTCGNDLSDRAWQMEGAQWLPGKTADGFGPIGPYVVPREALPTGGLRICSRVNGEVRQDSYTNDLIFDPAAIVAYIHPRIPLKAGDLIFTGTPSGVMLGRPTEQRQWLKPGDTVEVEIEGIGVLCNTLA